MWRGITGRTYTFTNGNGNIRFNYQSQKRQDLTLEESHHVDDGKTDDNYKLEKVVEEENLQVH